MKALLGRKIGMTQIFQDDKAVPVTVVKAGPCMVTQVKSKEKDGYWAIQLGLLENIKEKSKNKPLRGHLKKVANPPIRVLREVRWLSQPPHTLGETLKVDIFEPQEYVDVVGISKGKGFQGVVRRHHFRGGRATHGSMFHRAPGSIGQSSFPSRVWKGLRMAGHMGGQRRTIKNLTIAHIDPDRGLLFIKGSIPGSPGSLVMVKSAKRG